MDDFCGSTFWMLFWSLCLIAEGVLLRSAVTKWNEVQDSIIRKAHFVRYMVFPLVAVENALQLLMGLRNFWQSMKPSQEKTRDNLTQDLTIFNFWMDKIFWKSFKKKSLHLKPFDLKETYSQANGHFSDQTSTNSSESTSYNAISLFFASFGKQFVISGLQRICQEMLAFSAPEILRIMVTHFTDTMDKTTWKDYFYVTALITSLIARNILGLFYWKNVTAISIKCRSMLHSIVIQKALRICITESTDTTRSTLLNIMGADSQKICHVIPLLHTLWIAPIQTIVATYFLYNLLGYPAFAAVSIIFMLILLTTLLMRQLKDIQTDQMKAQDSRVKIVSETIQNLKTIKLHAWNEAFLKKIGLARQLELDAIWGSLTRLGCMVTSFTVAPVIVLLVVLVMKSSLDGEPINAGIMFAALSIINIITVPLLTVPALAMLLSQTTVSIKRINKFLNLEEFKTHKSYVKSDKVTNDDTSIKFENAYLSWDSKKSILKNLHFTIPPGSLVAIVGESGSGKSSLLQAMSGNMFITKGKIDVNGKIAYVPESTWTRKTTIKENILLHNPFNKETYLDVINACELDLSCLPMRDDTEILDNGSNLSGGQRQRISLARAAYSGSNIYLMDQPMSALDGQTANKVYTKLLSLDGLLKEKTRIVATDYGGLIADADIVLELDNGAVKYFGPNRTIYRERTSSKFGEDDEMDIFPTYDALPQCNDGGNLSESIKPREDRLLVKKSLYLREGGVTRLTIGITLVICSVAVYTFSNVWLSMWSGQDDSTQIKSAATNITIYGSVGLVQAILLLLGCLYIYNFSLKASRNLYDILLLKVLNGRIHFLNKIGAGSLLNVLTKDVDILESSFPQNMQGTVLNFLLLLSAIFTTCYATPIFLVFVAPLAIIYYFLQRLYVVTSTNLRRNESLTRTPLYSLVLETLSGLCSIKAFGIEHETMREIQDSLLENNKAYFLYMAGTLWIKARLDILGTLIVSGTCVFAIISKDTLSPAVVALSLSSALQITQLLNYFVKLTSEFESNIVAVERVVNTTLIPQERNCDACPDKVNEVWPETGELLIKDLQLRYEQNSQPILEIESCAIKSGEKIGVVGRSGAGKSSLLMAIFKLLEPIQGQIALSGLNTSQLSMHNLRSKIAIVPQEPTFFSESLRFNLDPVQCYTDHELWNALDTVNLKEFVFNLPHGLYFHVTPDDTRITSGCKQLLCLTRALLKKPKFLVLDEVTANCDKNIELLIQEIVKEQFKNSTVLIVAHRFKTLLDCDRLVAHFQKTT
ncbi:Multidrug resistance-associated protein 1 [Folsomia candida]|uniref:Multidrug resistance-associated protein 1 n=1 Tax=Folsomia candida TaxID=158441 RepID=A0A226CWU6_FOLCA|nr:Multidrug resistance-associated protein 1 [Folsomia candida]